MHDEAQADKFDGETAAPAVSWLSNRLRGAGPYLAPIIAALLVIGLFGAYYLVHVRVRRDYLVNRNFRALAILGDQIEGNVGNHIDVLWSFVDGVDPRVKTLDHGRAKANILDFREEEDGEADYMHFLAPDLKLRETKRDPKLQAPKLQVRRQKGRWELVMAAVGLKKVFIGTVGLEELFRPFVDSAPFDDVLLAAEDGSIIFQKAKTGPQFVNLTALLQSQAEAADQKPADPGPAEKNTAEAGGLIQANDSRQWQNRPLHLTEITIAGVRYQLFLQPVLIDVFHEDYPTNSGNASDDSDAGAVEKPREWVLCGLIPSATLQWQSLAISYEFMIWMTVGFLAVLLGAPLLKLLFLNKREHLHLRECAAAGVSLILLTALTTFASLQAIYFTFGDSDQGQKQLGEIASSMATQVRNDIQKMHHQLVSFCRQPLLRDDLQSLQKNEQQIYELGINRNSSGTSKHDAERESLRGGMTYHYLSNAFWTDDDGHQLIKWSGSEWATPMIDLAEVDLFKNLNEESLAEHPLLYLDGVPQPFHFESTLAPNKVEYLAAVGMRTSDCVDAGFLSSIDSDVGAGRAFLIAEPFSLIDSVLPLGYGFALVGPNGKVLFHSDKTRNTRENFLEETDSNRELYSALLREERTDRPLKIQYFGKDYLVHIERIPRLKEDGKEGRPARLSLIVYRDLTQVRTLNLETAAISSTLFIFLLVPPALVAVSLYMIRQPRHIAEPFWPHKERIAAYVYQTGICVLFSLLLLLISWNSKSQDRLIGCGILLYGALFFIYWAFWLKCPECPGVGAGTRPRSHGRTLAASVITIVFAGWAVWMASGHQIARLAWLLPVFAICALPLSGPLRTAFNEKMNLWTSRAWFPGWRAWHAASLASLLLLLGVTVPVTLFRATLRVERGLQDRRETQYRKEAEQRRQALFRNFCEVNGLSRNCAPDSSTWSFAGSSGTGDGKPDPLSDGFSRLFYSLHHNYNPTAAENLAMLSNEGLPAPTTPDYALTETAAGVFIIVLASVLVWGVGGKLFLLDYAWPEKYSEKVRAMAVGGQPATVSGDPLHPATGAECVSGGESAEPAFEDPNNQSLIMDALETEAPRYQEFWSSSSEDERFVLMQLASDGVLNPINAGAIRSLVKRGLIVRKPQFQIVKESFRRFVLGRPSMELKHRWLAESRGSGWGKLSGVFMTVVILVAVFLLATQNALWESAAAYVTTALGGLGTVLRLLHLVRGEKAS